MAKLTNPQEIIRENNKNIENQKIVENIEKSEENEKVKFITIEENTTFENNENLIKYEFYDIPLSRDMQKFIQDECNKYDLSVSLVYGIIQAESSFKKGLVSSTNDHGYMQVNRKTFNWINKSYFNNKLNIKNEKHIIKVGTFYLNYLKTNFNKNMSDEDVFRTVIICYNRGLSGGQSYIKKHGYNNSYLNKVIKYKQEIERGCIEI